MNAQQRTQTNKTARAVFAVLLALLCAVTVASISLPAHAATHDHSTWTAVTATGGTLASGNYKLTAQTDLTGGITIANGAEVTLCLAGNVLSGLGIAGTSVITVGENATLTLCDCVGDGAIIGGSATNGGGIYVNSGASLTLSGVKLYECKATSYGGAIYADEHSAVTVTGSVIHTCTASRGGAIYSFGTLTLDGGSKIYSTSASYGGDVGFAGSTMTVQNTSIFETTASTYGGGIYIAQGAAVDVATTVTLGAGTLVNMCAAEGNGGGICVTGGECILQNGATVTYCNATFGGGVSVLQQGKLVLSDATITQCQATSNGGGIQANGTTASVTLKAYATVERNTTDYYGGGIYLAGSVSLTMEANTTIERNTAASGGGIYAIYGASVSLSGATISGNTATDSRGGGIYTSCPLTMANTRVENNTAATDGGGIYAASGANLALSGGTSVRSNKAANGGGLYLVSGAQTSLAGNVEISANTATAAAGGIYMASNVQVSGRIYIANNTGTGKANNAYLVGEAVFVVGEGLENGANIYVFTPFADSREKVITSGYAALYPDAVATQFFHADETNTLFADMVLTDAGEVNLRKITYDVSLADGIYFGKDYNTETTLQGLLEFVTVLQTVGNNAAVEADRETLTHSLRGTVTFAGEGDGLSVRLRGTQVGTVTAEFYHHMELQDFPNVTYKGGAYTMDYLYVDGVKRTLSWMSGKGMTVAFANATKTDKGTYTVSVQNPQVLTDSDGQKYAWETTSAKWTIDPYELTANEVKFSGNSSVTYNNTQQTITVTVTVPGIGVITSGYTVSGNTAKNAGEYTVRVTGTDTGNFTGVVTYNWAITKANYNMSGVTFSNVSLPYNGTAQRPSVTGTLPTGLDGSRVTVSYSGSAVNVADGTVTVTATFAIANNQNNYYIPAAKTATVTITTLTVTRDDVTFSFEGTPLVYNNTLQTVSVTRARVNNLPVTYALTGNTATNAGDYRLTFTANGNFTGSFGVDWSMDKARYDLSGFTLADASYLYDGQPHTLLCPVASVTGLDGSRVDVVYNGGTQVFATNVADGRVAVTAALIWTTQSGNYYAPTTEVKTAYVSITPVTIQASNVTFGKTEFVYNNTEHTVVVNGDVRVGDLVATYTLTGNTATNVTADGYVAKLTGTGNFTGTVEQPWKITPISYDMSGITFADGSFVYTGGKLPLRVDGVLPTGLDGVQVKVTYENNANIAPGVYTVTAKFAGSQNYTTPADMTATLTILASRGEATIAGSESTVPHAIISSATGLAPDRVLKVTEVQASAYPRVDDFITGYHLVFTGASGTGTDGKVTVLLLVPDYVFESEEEVELTVFHIGSDGKMRELACVSEGSYLSVEVEELGDFLLCEASGSNVGLIILIVVGAVVALGLLVLMGGKKGGTKKPATANGAPKADGKTEPKADATAKSDAVKKTTAAGGAGTKPTAKPATPQKPASLKDAADASKKPASDDKPNA